MMDQVQLHNSVAALRQAMRDAWSTASDYDTYLCSSTGEPQVYENRLLRQVHDLFVRVAFLLEALQLPSLLAEFKAGFERFRHAEELDLATDEFGNPYPLALEYLAAYVSPLAAAISPPSESLDDLPRLERILEGTPKLIYDRGIIPSSEVDVRREIYSFLLHVFPDTVREIPIAQVSKTYKPDIGVRRLKAAVEYKFADSEEKAKRVIGGIYEDIYGYGGSSDWTTFYAVIYMTRPFLTRYQIEAEWQLTGVPHNWKPILVIGEGSKKSQHGKGGVQGGAPMKARPEHKTSAKTANTADRADGIRKRRGSRRSSA
jgi:hypothetical protein